MSEEKKTKATEDVKEARKLSMEELEKVSGGQTEELVVLAQLAKKGDEHAVIAKKLQAQIKTSVDNIDYIIKSIGMAEIEP